MKSKVFKAGLAAFLFLTAGHSAAADVVDGPVRLVVPFAAGGSVDAMARIVASGLEVSLGQPVVVENRTGAEGSIAAQAVIRSNPDGKTLLVGTTTQLLWVPLTRKEVPYDPLVALKPVGMLGEAAFFLYVNSSVPASTVNELISYAKDNPEKLHFAYGNSTGNIAAAQFTQKTGIKFNGVPYNGEAQAITDLLGDHVQMMFATTVSLLEQVKQGKVKVLAVVGSARSPLAPDVPTFNELGIDAVDLSPWSGVFASGGTPADLTTKLSDAVDKALSNPSVRERLEGTGLTIRQMSSKEMTPFISAELEKWEGIISSAGVVKK